MSKQLLKLFIAFAVCGALNAAFLSAPRDAPSYKEYAKLARFMVHRLDWTAIATLASNPAIAGYPNVGVISYSDSVPKEKSTGEIYMLLTDLDATEQDIKANNKLTAMFSMAQYGNCSEPMEPTCARLMISGSMVKIPTSSDEYEQGMHAYLSRHPAGNVWINTHNFYLAKIQMEFIIIQDYYGGPHVIPVDEYFAADPEAFIQPRSYRRMGRRRHYPRFGTSGPLRPTPY